MEHHPTITLDREFALKLLSTMQYVSGQFNAVNFTDRHGMGPVAKEQKEKLYAVLYPDSRE